MVDRNKHRKFTTGVEFINSPWHSLNEIFAEMVEGYCDLHRLVLHIRVTVAKEHHLHNLSFTIGEESNQIVCRQYRKESTYARDVLQQYPQHMQPTSLG
uniref:Uncharacterized protein n=1 Tax=Arundo donax TaxID=35708 RepID=A0A0A8ZCM8_ARUDO